MSKYLIHRIRVHGRVQGVGFRSFVSKLGHSHKIGGWVKNNIDGTVTIEARGLEERVRSFYDEVEKGSFFSRVDEFEELESQRISDEPDLNFEIIF
jgi:acylphosphatase